MKLSELSDQTRAVIAAALALIVILGWGFLFKTPPPSSQTQQGQAIAQSAGQTPGTPTASSASSLSTTGASAAHVDAAAPVVHKPTAPAAPAVSAGTEQNITIESDSYRVILSNRGAVARSWQLIKFTDEHEPPRTLDLVQSDASRSTEGWPFSLQINDPQVQSAANQGLYVITKSGAPV